MNPVPQAEDRVEHGAGGVRERPAVDDRHRRPRAAPAAEEAQAVGLELDGADRLALDGDDVGGPGAWIALGPRPLPRALQSHAAVVEHRPALRQPGSGIEVGDTASEHGRTLAPRSGRLRRQPVRQPRERSGRRALCADALHHARGTRRPRRARSRVPRRARHGGARPPRPGPAAGARSETT